MNGCLINSNRTRTVGAGEERVAVAFENDDAMRLFTQTLKGRYRQGKQLGTSHFAIPFIINSNVRRVMSEAAFFNAQVAQADLDGDDAISEAEARAYANEWEN
ncbi:MAG: hypothetical protein WD009_13105 [Phycisphaeraceae bacterium]